MKTPKTNFLNQIVSSIFAEDDYRCVFNLIFKELDEFIPYDRISLALVDKNWIRLEIVRTKYKPLVLAQGQRHILRGTSLVKLARTGKVRVINNLETHFKKRKKPISDINNRILQEGIKSSLTVPLIIKGNIFGYMFFSCREIDVYKKADVSFAQETAELMAIALQKSMLITELKNSCATLTKTNRELIKVNHLNDEVLSIAAHDIKNLINPIKLSSQALLRRNVILSDGRAKSYLNNIKEVSQQLDNLVSNILDISKNKMGKTVADITEFSPQDILNNVIQSWESQANRKKIKLELKLLKNSPKSIIADEIKFAQIFNNLVSNSIKFTDIGGKVIIIGKKSSNYYVFTVKDTGKGIDKQILVDIFKKFQTSKTGTRGERGTGFGLSVVKQFVDIHDGKIDVRSVVGKGSTFIVSFPIPRSS